MNKPNLTIGLCGAQGVGKSTLAKRLAEELGLPLITKQARKAARTLGLDKLPNPRTEVALSNAFQNLCLHYQLQEESKYPSFISDRTTIDNALYYLMNNAFHAEPADNMLYYQKCTENTSRYSLLVYIPIEFELKDDGFRDNNRFRQQEADFLIKGLLETMNPYYVIARGTVEERVKAVLRGLGIVENYKYGGGFSPSLELPEKCLYDEKGELHELY